MTKNIAGVKKNKPLKIILTALACVLLAAVTVYAAVIFSSWVVSKGSAATGALTHTVGDGTDITSLSVATASLSFTDPGDTSDFTATLTNNSASALHYYYTLTITDQAASDSLAQAILVYYDGEFLGTLSSLCPTGSATIDMDQIIASSASDSHKFSFELHIAAPDSIYHDKTVTVKITSYAENIDYKKYMVVGSDTEFAKAVDDINSGLLGSDVIIALSSDVTLSKNYTINYPCVIDLEGKELIIPSGISLTLAQSGTTTLKSSKAPTYSALSGSGSIVLNNTGALLVINDFFYNGATNVGKLYGNAVTLTSYNADAACGLLISKFAGIIGEGITASTNCDIFGALAFYANASGVTVTAGEGYTYSGGTITATDDTVTKVTSITVASGSTSETREFKIFGSADDTVYAGLLSGELAHIPDIANEVTPTVSSDIFLPKSVKSKNVTITWKSSDSATISDDGKISDTVKDSATVKLYAEIRVNSSVYTKIYTFRVTSQNNETKFAYIVAQLSPITLDTIYTGSNSADAYMYLPTVRELNNDSTYKDYDYRAAYVSPVSAQDTDKTKVKSTWTNSTLVWDAYKDVKLEWIDYSITNTYNYISLATTTRTVNSETHTDTAAVYLNTAVFYQYAQIEARGKFKGDDTIYEGTVNVIIKLGSNTELQNMVFDHVQSKLSNEIDVLHNILETRRASGMKSEKGDFVLESEYMSFDITYGIPTASTEIISGITSVTGGYNIGINAEGFDTTHTSVGITVTVRLKSGYGIADGELDTTIASRILYFDVPPALTPDDYGFSNDSVFNSVKYQVFQQLPSAEKITDSGFAVSGETVTNTTGRYILLRDLIYCDSLEFFTDETVTGTTNEKVYDLMRLVQWAGGEKKVAASTVIHGTYNGTTTTTNYTLSYNNAGTYSPITGATLTTVAPASQTASGTYLYYNTTDSKWQYYTTTGATSYTLTFNNCYQFTTARTSDYGSRLIYDTGTALNTNTTANITNIDTSKFIFITTEQVTAIQNFLTGTPTADLTITGNTVANAVSTAYYLYCPATGRFADSTYTPASGAQITTSATASVMYKTYYYSTTYPYALYSTDNTVVPSTSGCTGMNIHGATQVVCKYGIYLGSSYDKGSFWTPSTASYSTTKTINASVNTYDVYGMKTGESTRSLFTASTSGNTAVTINIPSSSATVVVTTGSITSLLSSTVSDGKEYLTANEIAVLKAFYQSVTGCSDAAWTTLLSSATTTATGYVISDGESLTDTIKNIINSGLSFRETDEFVYFKYVEIMQWALNEKDFGSGSLPSDADAGSSPNLGIISTRYGTTYNTGYTEDSTEYISEKEKAVIIAYWYAIPNSQTSTVDAQCGDVFAAAFDACTLIPTYLNYNGANLLARAMYAALDTNSTIDLSAFAAETTTVTLPDGTRTLICPHITNADDSFNGLSYFDPDALTEYLGAGNKYTYDANRYAPGEESSGTVYYGLKTLYVCGEINSNAAGLPAFLTTDALSAFYAKLTSSASALTSLGMKNCAQDHTVFDISQTKLLTNLTTLDLLCNYGIKNIGALLEMPHYESLKYLDVAGCDVADVYRIYTLKNIYVAGSSPTIYHTPDGGTRVLYTSTDSVATELTYLKEINNIDSYYLQLCKELVKTSESKSLVYWRIEQGNMMSLVSAAGRFPTIDTVAGMETLATSYYYCTTDFSYNGDNFTAGHIYKAGYSGGVLSFTEQTMTATTTIQTPTTSPVGTKTVVNGDLTVSGNYTTTGPATPSTTSTSGDIYYNNIRCYLYGVTSSGTPTMIGSSKYYYLGYTGTATYTYTYTYNTINRIDNYSYSDENVLYYMNGGNLIKTTYTYSGTQTTPATYTCTAQTTVYTGLYCYSYPTSSSTIVPTDAGYVYVFMSTSNKATNAVNNKATADIYLTPQTPKNPAPGGSWTYGTTVDNGGAWTLASTSTYISPVGTFGSTADATALKTLADRSSGGTLYYEYTGTTGTATVYDYGTASTHSYTNSAIYRLVANSNGFSWATTTGITQSATTATTMESILTEANTHISDALYGNYYGNYYYYTGPTATIGSHTYVNGKVYRLLGEVGGSFSFTNDIGTRSTCTTVSSITTLQQLLLDATASDIGKVYYYNGGSDRTYATSCFYEMTKSETTGAYYLKRFGAVNAGAVYGTIANGTSLLQTTATAEPSRLSNERYYANVSGGLYGGTGGTEEVVISAIVRDTSGTHIRKFLAYVIG